MILCKTQNVVIKGFCLALIMLRIIWKSKAIHCTSVNGPRGSFELVVIYSAKWKLWWVKKNKHMVTPDPYTPPLKHTLAEIWRNTKYLGLKAQLSYREKRRLPVWDPRTVTYFYMTSFRSRLLKAQGSSRKWTHHWVSLLYMPFSRTINTLAARTVLHKKRMLSCRTNHPSNRLTQD